MTKDRSSLVDKLPKVFITIINYKVVSNVKQELDTFLLLDICICNISLKFAASL